jgi:hypothetical protein
MEIVTLVAGLLLPCVLGIAALAAIRDTTRPLGAPGEIAWIAGAGYLTGAFLLTLWMRVLSLAGVRFGAVAIGLPLLLATVALAFVAWRRHGGGSSFAAIASAARALVAPADLAGATRLAWQLLVGWIALRYLLLALEVSWQPLYPWDAWIQWATKARVWYEEGTIVPFARSAAWFAAGGSVWFDASPEYPPTVPLLQVWTCIALGRWDDVLMNWPWWQFSVALTLAVYGALREESVTALPALVGAFLVASLPLANVHVALAGYADLPMAAYYTGAVLAFLRWSHSRSLRDAAVALFLAIACTQIKVPGLAWALTIVPGVVVALWPRRGPRYVLIGFAVALFALAVLAQTSPVILRYRLHLDFDPAWRALLETHFLLANWHLLWYAAIAAALLAWRQLASPSLAPLTAVAAAGALFLVVVFSFTNARLWVTEQTTINRATLHVAPLAAVFAVLAFRAFAARFAAARPVAAVTVSSVPPAT